MSNSSVTFKALNHANDYIVVPYSKFYFSVWFLIPNSISVWFLIPNSYISVIFLIPNSYISVVFLIPNSYYVAMFPYSKSV